MLSHWLTSSQGRLNRSRITRQQSKRRTGLRKPSSRLEQLEERSLLSAISVIASDPFASEGESTGTFVFSRDTVGMTPLSIGYSVGGTATAGSDYSALSGSVTIPAGALSASVVVNPFSDALSEGSESVTVNLGTVNLGTVAGHTLDLTSATVTIRDAFDGAGIGALAPLSETFTLNSLPGARHTIYLDLDGGQVNDPEWSAGTINVDPFTIDGSNAFSDEKLALIQRSREVVAEDFAPFSVNITTEEPDIEKLRKTSVSDIE